MTRRAHRSSSLGAMLTASHALLVLMIVVIGASGAWVVGVAVSTTRDLTTVTSGAERASARARLDLTRVRGGVHAYRLVGDDDLLVGVPAARASGLHELSRLRRDVSGEAGRAAARADRRARAWVATYVDPVLRAVADGRAVAQLPAADDADAAGFARYDAAAAEVDRLLDADLEAGRVDVDRLRVWGPVFLALVSVLALTAGILAAYLISRSLTRPLRRVRTVLDRLATGEDDARAHVETGPTEVLAVGRALDALADESERLRTAERERLVHRRVAHDVGLRVRDRLVVDEVEQAAVSEVGTSFGVERVLLRRTHDSSLGPVSAEWHEVDLDPLDDAARAAIAEATDAGPARGLWDGVEVSIHDAVPGAATPWPAAAAGLEEVVNTGNVLVLAFGAGQDVLGTLTLVHATPRDWSAAEVSALESIAADVGRAWQHAALYERERRLVRELQELDRTKTDFMSTVSHELRTPLTSITGYVELLRDQDVGPVTSDQMRMLDAVGRNADRLLSLIEDLLALSHIESRGFRAQVVPVDVASLVHNAGSAVEPQAAAAGVTLTLRDGRTDADRRALGPAQVIGDPGQLDRVLLNLLSNAVKFTPEGGRVELSWSLSPDEVVVHVRDTGIGVPEEELARIGTRFYRASNATSAAIQGTGLGLTIVRGILEQHGGTLELSSPPGEGTDACVRLPRPPTGPDDDRHREQTHPVARL